MAHIGDSRRDSMHVRGLRVQDKLQAKEVRVENSLRTPKAFVTEALDAEKLDVTGDIVGGGSLTADRVITDTIEETDGATEADLYGMTVSGLDGGVARVNEHPYIHFVLPAGTTEDDILDPLNTQYRRGDVVLYDNVSVLGLRTEHSVLPIHPRVEIVPFDAAGATIEEGTTTHVILTTGDVDNNDTMTLTLPDLAIDTTVDATRLVRVTVAGSLGANNSVAIQADGDDVLDSAVTFDAGDAFVDLISQVEPDGGGGERIRWYPVAAGSTTLA